MLHSRKKETAPSRKRWTHCSDRGHPLKCRPVAVTFLLTCIVQSTASLPCIFSHIERNYVIVKKRQNISITFYWKGISKDDPIMYLKYMKTRSDIQEQHICCSPAVYSPYVTIQTLVCLIILVFCPFNIYIFNKPWELSQDFFKI